MGRDQRRLADVVELHTDVPALQAGARQNGVGCAGAEGADALGVCGRLNMVHQLKIGKVVDVDLLLKDHHHSVLCGCG